MVKMNTSAERVDSLMKLSDQIYPAIDERIGGETRAHRILRLQVNAVANELEAGTIESAGRITESILISQLGRSGIFLSAFTDFPAYIPHAKTLPEPPHTQFTQLNELARKYGSTQRGTLDATGEREHDARHAVHLESLAPAYAAQYYPELNTGKVVVYLALHDILEAYVGDVNTYNLSKALKEKKHQDEIAALKMLALEYGYSWPAFVGVIQDYEALKDPEARYAKTFDKLDPAFTHYNNRGHQILHYHGTPTKKVMLENMDKRTEEIAPYGNEFPLVMEDRIELTKRVADHIEWPATETIIV